MTARLPIILAALLVLLPGLSSAQERLLFIGNSITLHGPAPKIGWTGKWGMAASAADKDYVHLVVAGVTKKLGHEPAFHVANVAEFERNYADYDLAAKLKDSIDFHADTIILAIAENVPALKTDDAKNTFRQRVIELLKLLQGDRKSTIIVRSGFWADAAKDNALKQACAEVGGIFTDISSLSKDTTHYARSEREIAHEGVGRHPGDKGMKAIADAILAVLPASK